MAREKDLFNLGPDREKGDDLFGREDLGGDPSLNKYYDDVMQSRKTRSKEAPDFDNSNATDEAVDNTGRSLGSGELSQAEQDSAIGGLYKAAGVDPQGIGGEGGNKLMMRIRGINRRRKILAGAGVGGIIGLLLAILIITPIYRVPALMSKLESELGAQVNDIVEARAERMIILYLIAKAGGNPTDFVVTGSPLSDIWRTFQSRKIEKEIFEKTGIQFYKAADGKVHIRHDGRDLGFLRDEKGEKAYREVTRILERGTIKTKRDFKIIIKTVLPAIRFHKASVEAKSFKTRFLRGRTYGSPRLPDTDANLSDEAKATKLIEKLSQQQIDAATENGIDLFRLALDCLASGTNCDIFKQEDPDAIPPDPDSEAARRNRSNGSSDEIADQVDEAAGEAKKEAIKDRKGGFVSRFIEKLLTKVIGATAARLAVKAIPYVGWFDVLATLQHIAGNLSANHLFWRIPALLKQGIYGAIFATWEGYSHEQMRGKMPLSVVKALNEQISGAENSQAHHLLYKGTSDGVEINPPIGSDKDSKYGNLIDSIYNHWYVRYGPVRGIFEAWYYTMGKVLNWVSEKFGILINWLMEVSGFTAWAEHQLTALFGENWKQELANFAVHAITWMFGLLIDPLARGAEMLNNLFAGAAAALNYHCFTYLGCRTLTEKDSVWFFSMQQQKERDEMAMASLNDRLFSLDLPNSLLSTLVRNAPADNKPGTVAAALFREVAALPSSVVNALSPKARAANFVQYASAAGVQWYGALPTDLDRDVAPELRQQTGDISTIECRQTKPSEDFNECMADKAVIKSFNCMLGNPCPEWEGGQ